MLVNEAILLSTIIDRIAPGEILDIGSGSRADREIIQPHIAAAFRGYYVIWTDQNGFAGGMQADITQTETLDKLPDCPLVTACSVLEHVVDIPAAIRNLRDLAGRWLIVSVPYRYPKHECPIDNMWRPDPEELSNKVAGDEFEIVGAYLTQPEQFGDVAHASATLVVLKRLEGMPHGGLEAN
jgi:hypothetical protein